MSGEQWIDGATLDAAILAVLIEADGPRTAGQIARADRLEHRATATARMMSLRRLVDDGKVVHTDKWDGRIWRRVPAYAVAVGEEVAG